jgi:hypothetical protein
MRVNVPSCRDCGHAEVCKDVMENGACLYSPEIHAIFDRTLGHFEIKDFSYLVYWVDEMQGIFARFIRKRMG